MIGTTTSISNSLATPRRTTLWLWLITGFNRQSSHILASPVRRGEAEKWFCTLPNRPYLIGHVSQQVLYNILYPLIHSSKCKNLESRREQQSTSAALPSTGSHNRQVYTCILWIHLLPHRRFLNLYPEEMCIMPFIEGYLLHTFPVCKDYMDPYKGHG